MLAAVSDGPFSEQSPTLLAVVLLFQSPISSMLRHSSPGVNSVVARQVR